MGAGGRDVAIRSLAADPRRPGTIYAGTLESGLFKSTDWGRRWVPSSSGLPSAGYRVVDDVVVDPHVPGRLFAAAGVGGVFASFDGGATWKPRSRGLPAAAVYALAVEARSGRLWAGTATGEILTSVDRGATWTLSARGLARVLALAVDPDRPGLVIAGTGIGLYRTANRGRSWVRVGGAVLGPVPSVAYQPAQRRFYAAVAKGIAISGDGSLLWIPVGLPDPDVLALAAGPQAVYAGTLGAFRLGGVFRSQDGGFTWSFRSRGLSTLPVAGLAVDPVDPERLYVSVPRLGIFRSADRGASWTRLPIPSAAVDEVSMISRILLDPVRPSTIYVNLGCSILRSDDGGDTWRLVVPEPVRCFDTLALDPRGPDALWGGNANTLDFEQGGIFHSADGGVTWTSSPGFPKFFGARDVAVHPSDPEIVLAAGTAIAHIRPTVELGPQIFRTVDGGDTWRDLWSDFRDFTEAAAVQVALDPAEPATVYAAIVPGGLYRTANGSSWTLVLDKEVHFAAATSTAVYAATALGDVLRSEDGGETWTSIRRGLGWRVVTRLTVDPHDPRRLYAATETGGVYTFTEPD